MSDSPAVEVTDGRRASLPGLSVVRVRPTRHRRTVGAWCFVDCMLPPEVAEPDPMEVGPHPHIGLSTVTWLFAGEAVHGDSLGTEQVIRPGQLNLMTAGNGIAHAELGLGTGLQGIQMWVAQPESTRHGDNAFQHLAELPVVDLGEGEATVFMGGFRDASSEARHDTPLVGMELRLGAGVTELELDGDFEHAVVPTDATVAVNGTPVDDGRMGYLATGGEAVRIEAPHGGARVMLLGGRPLGERVSMWWNFVARDHDEITAAWQDWQDRNTERFGDVPSELERIDAPTPPWVRA